MRLTPVMDELIKNKNKRTIYSHFGRAISKHNLNKLCAYKSLTKTITRYTYITDGEYKKLSKGGVYWETASYESYVDDERDDPDYNSDDYPDYYSDADDYFF